MSIGNIGNRVTNVVVGVITAVILIMVGVALGPTVIDSITDINATSMADVFLGDVIVTLSDFIPLFYYLAIVTGGMAMIWASIRFGKN